MKILSYIKGLDASSYHRVLIPNRGLNEEVREVKMLSEEDLKWCDILHYNRHSNMSAKFIDSMRQKHGFKVIVDNDDWWEVHPDHPKYDFWSKSNLSYQIQSHLMNADAVICTNDALAEETKKINDRVFVIPNALDYGNGQFSYREQPKSDKVRLLYASTIMNYSNTSIIANAYKKLSHLNIEIVITGYHDLPYFDKLVKNLTGGLIPHRFIDWMDCESYMNGYEGDIMILPSKKTDFNRFKSNLKILEAGVLKMPIVVSENEPYLGMPVNYFNGENEFVDQVIKLVESKEYRESAGSKLYDAVTNQFSISNFSNLRRSIYENI